MTIKYCIHCEKKVNVFYPVDGVIAHTNQVFDSFPPGQYDAICCDGPFTECPPPEMTEEFWEATLERDDYTLHEEGLAEDFVI